MRWLAIARYKYINILRTTKGVFPILLVASLACVLPPGWLLMPDFVFYRSAGNALRGAAVGAILAYVVHLFAIVAICWSYGVVPRRPEGLTPADLMETAPILGRDRFWGDTLGIFGATITLHACVAPLLAAAIAVSPHPSSLFWKFETAVAIAIAFASAAAAWSLRADTSRWSQTRTARSGSLLLIMVATVFFATTYWEEFRDAWPVLLMNPTPAHWHTLLSAIHSPTLLILGLATVYVGFIAFYCAHSVHSIDRA